MMCPVCKTRHNKVLETRANPDFVLRKRICANGHKYQTKEYAITDDTIFEAPIREEPKTPKASGGFSLSKLWHR